MSSNTLTTIVIVLFRVSIVWSVPGVMNSWFYCLVIAKIPVFLSVTMKCVLLESYCKARLYCIDSTFAL